MKNIGFRRIVYRLDISFQLYILERQHIVCYVCGLLQWRHRWLSLFSPWIFSITIFGICKLCLYHRKREFTNCGIKFFEKRIKKVWALNAHEWDIEIQNSGWTERGVFLPRKIEGSHTYTLSWYFEKKCFFHLKKKKFYITQKIRLVEFM